VRYRGGVGRHALRDGTSGRYESTAACDACGRPTGADYFTDDEVCGNGDGPGFRLCARSLCMARRDVLS